MCGAVMCAAICVLLCPETYEKRLPDTLEEAKELWNLTQFFPNNVILFRLIISLDILMTFCVTNIQVE